MVRLIFFTRSPSEPHSVEKILPYAVFDSWLSSLISSLHLLRYSCSIGIEVFFKFERIWDLRFRFWLYADTDFHARRFPFFISIFCAFFSCVAFPYIENIRKMSLQVASLLGVLLYSGIIGSICGPVYRSPVALVPLCNFVLFQCFLRAPGNKLWAISQLFEVCFFCQY